MFIQQSNFPRPAFDYWDKPAGKQLQEVVRKHYHLVESSDSFSSETEPTTTVAYQHIMKAIAEGFDQTRKWKASIEALKQHFPEVEIVLDIKQQPGVGAIMTLQRLKQSELTASKKLHIYHSLLGPFYTLFGVDEAYYYNGRFYPMRFDPIITATPVEEYDVPFVEVLIHLQQAFPESFFLPFIIGRRPYPGLRTPWSPSEEDHSLLQALFVNHDYGQYSFRGDLFFGLEEWSDITPRGGWTAHPPNTSPI